MILLPALLSACQQNIFSNLEQNFNTEDNLRAERITKEALAAAAEAETAATALQDALHSPSVPAQVPIYQVYSQTEYDQKINALQNDIRREMVKLNESKVTESKNEHCQTAYRMFKQLYDLIYYNPEYATPKTKLESHLQFFLSQHHHWTQSCKNGIEAYGIT